MGILKPQQTALVTGSSRGIGAAGGRAVSVRADLTENEKLVHLFERTTDLGAPLGGGVVHNAGIQLLGSHAEMSGENVDRLTAANLKAAFSVLSQAARRVVEGGRIIALSSGTSVVLPPRYGVRATKSHPQSLLGGGIHVRALTEGVREPYTASDQADSIRRVFTPKTLISRDDAEEKGSREERRTAMNRVNETEVRWLSFRLRNGQSIGPEKLRAAWEQAAETRRCAVRREVFPGGLAVYSLYGPGFLISPQKAEESMRAFLTKEGYVFTMTHVVGKERSPT